MAASMHDSVDFVASLFRRHTRRSTNEGTAYEAVHVEDEDGEEDNQRSSRQDVPMREIHGR